MGQEESYNLKTYLSTIIQDDCFHHLRHSVQLAENAHDDTEMDGFLHRVHVLGGHDFGWRGGRGHRWDHDPVVAADGVETKVALAARRKLSQVRVNFLKKSQQCMEPSHLPMPQEIPICHQTSQTPGAFSAQTQSWRKLRRP